MTNTAKDTETRLHPTDSAFKPLKPLLAGQIALRAMTREQRSQAARKGQAALTARRAAAKTRYRTDFSQSHRWEAAAAKIGARLPQWHEQPTPANIRKWCKRLGVPMADYYAWIGGTDLAEFSRYNPTFPLRYLVGGMCVEIADYGSLVEAEGRHGR